MLLITMFYFLNFPQVFSHSLSGRSIPLLNWVLLRFLPLFPLHPPLWKIPLISASGFEQKLWAKRLIRALIPLA